MMAGVMLPDTVIPKPKRIALTRAAVARIVTAVESSGRTQARAPNNLDLDKLGTDLNFAWANYLAGKAGSTVQANNARERRLHTIAEQAAKLGHLLDEDRDKTGAAGMVGGYLRPDYVDRGGDSFEQPTLAELRHDLQELYQAAVLALEPKPVAPWLTTTTPLSDLCGKVLPDIYQQHFKKKPGGGRLVGANFDKNVGNSSPYLRFGCAVANEFGEQFSEETLISYLARWKKRASEG
jgi:hypothetical protein